MMWIKYVHETTALRNTSGNVFPMITEVTEGLYTTPPHVHEEPRQGCRAKRWRYADVIHVWPEYIYIVFTLGKKNFLISFFQT